VSINRTARHKNAKLYAHTSDLCSNNCRRSDEGSCTSRKMVHKEMSISVHMMGVDRPPHLKSLPAREREGVCTRWDNLMSWQLPFLPVSSGYSEAGC